MDCGRCNVPDNCIRTRPITREAEPLPISKKLAYSVLSLPMHTELTHEIQDKVIGRVKEFFK